MNFLKIGNTIWLLTFVLVSCNRFEMSGPGNLVAKTVVEDFNLPQAQINGVHLHTEAFGHPDSTLIVVLHGGPGGDYRYLLNCADLAFHDYRVVFYDQIGSGLSERKNESFYTSKGMGVMDLLFEELQGIIDHYKTHEAQKVYLLGHSWGGMLATAFLGRFPESAQGLVVIEPGGLKWADVKDYLSSSMQFKLWDERLNDATFIDQIIQTKSHQQELIDYKMTIFINLTAPHWRMGASVQYAFRKIGDKYYPDFSEGIRNFEVPVLFIYSENNPSYPDSWANKISAPYKFVEVSKIEGVGHSGMIRNNDVWNETTKPMILNYFQSI